MLLLQLMTVYACVYIAQKRPCSSCQSCAALHPPFNLRTWEVSDGDAEQRFLHSKQSELQVRRRAGSQCSNIPTENKHTWLEVNEKAFKLVPSTFYLLILSPNSPQRHLVNYFSVWSNPKLSEWKLQQTTFKTKQPNPCLMKRSGLISDQTAL